MDAKRNRYVKPTLAAMIIPALLIIATIALGQSALDHFNSAKELKKAGKPDLAIEELRKAVEMEPQNGFYETELGMAYIDTGYIQSALEHLERAVSLNDSIPDAYTGLGVCYNTIGDFQKSIENFEKAIELTPETSPDSAVLYNNIGQNFYLMGDYDQAEEFLNKALELDDSLLTGYINLGNVYTERGDYERSIEFHQKAVEVAPEYPLPRNNLAFAYYMMHDYEKAIAEMQKVLDIAPGNKQFKENYNFLVAKYEEYKEQTFQEGPLAGLPKEIGLREKPPWEASRDVAVIQKQPAQEETAVAQAPVPTSASSSEDKTYEPMERDRTAREHAATEEPAEQPTPTPTPTPAPVVEPAPAQPEPVVAETPAAPPITTEPVAVAEKTPVVEETTPAAEEQPAVVEMAQSPAPTEREHSGGEYQRMERKRASLYKDEREAIAEATEENKQIDNAEELYNAAKYNLKIGDVNAARNDIAQALDIVPDNPDYLTVEAMVISREGRLHEAATLFRRILEDYPEHSAARDELGRTQELLGRMDIAEDEYAQAFGDDPVNGCAAGNLGSRMVFDGNCEEAAELLNKAVERQCLTASVLNNLAYCYFEKGDTDNAMQLIHRAVEKEPGNDVILSNFSFLTYETGFDFQPIKITSDTEIDPFRRAMLHEKIIPLNSLTPVEALDFYDIIENNYTNKTVLVMPFQNVRGTERWKPTPAQLKTERLAGLLRASGKFNVMIGSPDNYDEAFRDKVAPDNIEKTLKRTPADIVFVGDFSKTIVEDEEKSMYFGLKKKDYVTSTLPVMTTILDTATGDQLVDSEITGTSKVANRVSSTMMYGELRDLRDEAFDDYAVQVSDMLLEHYNLVRHPVRKDIVKYVRKKPWRKAIAGLVR